MSRSSGSAEGGSTGPMGGQGLFGGFFPSKKSSDLPITVLLIDGHMSAKRLGKVSAMEGQTRCV